MKPARFMTAAAVAFALAFALLAADAARPHVFRLDRVVQAWARTAGHPALDAPMRALALLGSGYVVVGLSVVGYALLGRAGHPLARRVPPAIGGALLVEMLAKWGVARPRPDGTANGFPSGHAFGVAMLSGAVAWLIWTSRLRWEGRAVGVVFAVVVTLGVGYCRIYLNVHWLSDVVGGLCGGVACLLLVLLSLPRR